MIERPYQPDYENGERLQALLCAPWNVPAEQQQETDSQDDTAKS